MKIKSKIKEKEIGDGTGQGWVRQGRAGQGQRRVGQGQKGAGAKEGKAGAEAGRTRAKEGMVGVRTGFGEILSNKQGFGDGSGGGISSRYIVVNSSSIHRVIENSIVIGAYRRTKDVSFLLHRLQ